MEFWRTIDGFENYKVSNLGNVKRLDSLVYQSGKFYKYKGRILKQENVKGYKRVSLSKGKIIKRFQVHRLVAMCFHINFNDKKCVNHINGIKTDNRSVNLEWCTYSENEKHSYNKLGKITNGLKCRKINIDNIEEIKKLYKKGFKQKEIAKIYNVNQSVISRLINQKTYAKHV
jgi:hypothetical protein